MFSKLWSLGLAAQFSVAKAYWYYDFFAYESYYCTNCQGGQTPCWYAGDGWCDDFYHDMNCAEYNYDGGDCNSPRATAFVYPPSGEAGATIRLTQINGTGSADLTTGVLEILVDGNWSTLCGSYNDVSVETASVACRDLGFASGRAVPRSSVDMIFLEAPSNQLVNYTRVCTGEEESFSDCAAAAEGDNCPDYTADVTLQCSSAEDFWCTDCEGGTSLCGAIGNGYCDDRNYVYDASGQYYYTNFACAELNYDGGDCPIPEQLVYYYNPEVENATIRLAQFNSSSGTFDNGTAITGLLQVYHDGVWGTVCDSVFGSADQGVACRELGFESGSFVDTAYLGFEYGDLPFDPHMDYVACFGNESSLLDCAHQEAGYFCSIYPDYYAVGLHCHAVDPDDNYHAYNYDYCRDCDGKPGYCPYVGDGDCDSGSAYYNYNCSEYDFDEGDCVPQDISYYTNPDNLSPTIRLGQLAEHAAENDGESATGLLEVFFEGEWGTVCASRFGSIDQKVACRELGFETGSFVSRYSLGVSDLTVAHSLHMNDVTCEGSEEALVDCWHHDVDTCSHYQDVGLYCFNNVTEEYSHHYYAYDFGGCPDCYGQSTPCYYVGDGWCDDDSYYGHLNCAEFNFDGGDCVPPESHDVELYYKCVDDSTDVRLVSLAPNTTDATLPTSVVGMVEVRDNDGVWGPICSNPYSDGSEAAQVVCNQLGLAGGELLWRSDTGLTNGDLNNQRAVYDAAECSGTEASIFDCDLTPSIYRCSGTYFMSVNCTVDSKTVVDCSDTATDAPGTDAPGTETTEGTNPVIPGGASSSSGWTLALGAFAMSIAAAIDARF